MAYEWRYLDGETGEPRIVVFEGEPCTCVGEDMPHPYELCERIKEGGPWR